MPREKPAANVIPTVDAETLRRLYQLATIPSRESTLAGIRSVLA